MSFSRLSGQWIALWAAALTLFSLAVSSDNDLVPSQPGIKYAKIIGKDGRTPDVPSKHYHSITAHCGHGTKHRRSAAAALGVVQRMHSGGAYENVTANNVYGIIYTIQLLWGKTPVSVILDTGSSDTWVVQSNFTCLSSLGDKVDQASCWFGSTYNGTFSGGSIFDQHLFIQYGDGETAYGPMGYQNITVGNLTVERLEVGLVNSTYWQGDNITSGIMGLAYPCNTNAYFGASGSNGILNEVEYPPVFTNIVQQGLSAPYFAIALERNSSAGVISFGGTPPYQDVDYSDAAETPIIIVRRSMPRPHPGAG
jgi:hypothetical protein